MLLGKVLAQAAMLEGKQVAWFPAYGPEVRGGTSHCMVTISDQEIGSPYITAADTLIILNHPSLERFQGKLKEKGMLILNSSFFADILLRCACAATDIILLACSCPITTLLNREYISWGLKRN